jgi:hypothetical protein
MASLFSPFVIEALVRAAQTPNTPDAPTARTRALEKATAFARYHHPQLFRKD